MRFGSFSPRLNTGLGLGLILALLACGSSDESGKCKDGATQTCSCDKAEGVQACKDGSYGACSCEPDAGVTPGGRLKGRVFDADTGRAVDQALLKTADGTTTKSDAQGFFDLPEMKGAKLEVSHTNYAPAVKSAPGKGYLEVFIKDLDETVEIDAGKNNQIELKSGAGLLIPGGAVRDAAGKKVSGKVSVSVTYVDGKERKHASAMPGNLEALGPNGKAGRVGIEGALEIHIKDASGKLLNVAAEDDVVAEFPIKSLAAPYEAKGFSYDEAKAKWIVETLAVKRVLNEAGKRVYRKDIDHLSWHAFGELFVDLTCLRACVTDAAKQGLEGAQVWSVGASFPGVAAAFTSEDGCIALSAPINQELVLVAQHQDGVSKALRYTTLETIVSVEASPDKCDDKVDPLVIGTEAPSSCPGGYAECDGACSDLATDAAHCGACATACAGSAGRAEACVAGGCECPLGTTACGEGANKICADLANDPANCGECGNDVTLGELPQACVNGKPEAITCATRAEQVCDGDCVNLSRNEGNCGECGNDCDATEICLGDCVPLNSPTLCTNPEGAAACVDNLWCNGSEICDPASALADQSGCVRGPPACGATQSCDEEIDACYSFQCNETPYSVPAAGPPYACGFGAKSCIAVVAATLDDADPPAPGVALANVLICGQEFSSQALGGLDELGQPYDGLSCIRNFLMICAQNGCLAQGDALDCCVQASQCTDQSCLQEACAPEFNALDACFRAQAQGSRCYDTVQTSICIDQG